MQLDGGPKQRHPTLEAIAVVGQLLLIFALLAALVASPAVVSRWAGPWVGAVAALAAAALWMRFGPSPMPGLLGGLLSICGCLAILGSFIVCVIRGIRDLFA